MTRDARLAPVQERRHDLEQLVFVHRTAPQFEVDRHVIGDGRGGRQGLDVFGRGVDNRQVLADILVVAQGLDSACRGTRADRHEEPRLPADLLDPLGVGGSRDRALDEREGVRALDHGA